jgi:hypothetical protein
MVIRTVRHRLLVISCCRAAQTDTVPESLGTPAPLKATPSRQPRIVQLASKILNQQPRPHPDGEVAARLVGWVPTPNKA